MNKAPEAFRTISEVAEELELPQHVLRFWESRFPQVRPMKRGGGRRYYRPDDVDLLRGIRHLLYGEGYTIRGVQRILREQGGRFVQTVWQDGAPQPERIPELDAEDHDAEDGIAVAVVDAAEGAEEAESPASAAPPIGPARQPAPDTDPYGRREPSFGPVQAPPPRPAPPVAPVVVAPAPVRESLVRESFVRDTVVRDAVVPEPAARDGEAASEPAAPREPILVERAAPAPVVIQGLTDADRERLGAVLSELEACRHRLTEALAEPEQAP
ncbi:MerR family transcriptional regulator [Rhodoplanes roseus]|uniref:MerR family transcriptional regulator n=1 Tax=Rhodoplanes roseus TaxID=29409 RepID=UPI0026BEEEB5